MQEPLWETESSQFFFFPQTKVKVCFLRFQARSVVILLDFISSPTLCGGTVHGRADVFLLLLMTFPILSAQLFCSV